MFIPKKFLRRGKMKKVAFVTTTSTNAAKGADVLRRAGIKNETIKIQGGTAS